MFCSTVIPTVGRPTFDRAVRSVLGQTLSDADFEIIVVNDSGRELPTRDWMAAPKVRVIETDRQERSVARNRGAAIAHGRFLHFLDDDDRILPGALETFWRLSRTAEPAQWLCGGYSTVDNFGAGVSDFRPDWTGDPTA